MLLLSLMACLESAKDLLSIQVDMKKDFVHVRWVMQDVTAGEKCGAEASIADCVQELHGDREMFTEAFKTTTGHTEAFVVNEGRLDFVVEYTAQTSFFASGGANQVQQVQVLSLADLAKGAPGKSAVAVLFENDPKERLTTVKAEGSTKLLRMPQKEGETTDLWLIEKGKASFEATVIHLEDGKPEAHGLLAAKPGLLEAMKAEKLL